MLLRGIPTYGRTACHKHGNLIPPKGWPRIAHGATKVPSGWKCLHPYSQKRPWARIPPPHRAYQGYTLESGTLQCTSNKVLWDFAILMSHCCLVGPLFETRRGGWRLILKVWVQWPSIINKLFGDCCLLCMPLYNWKILFQEGNWGKYFIQFGFRIM